MRHRVVLLLLIVLSIVSFTCGSSPSQTGSVAGGPQFEPGDALALVKKELRRVAASQNGCDLVLRIGGWNEEYEGDGVWTVKARLGPAFRVIELTSAVQEANVGSAHSHDRYTCHPSQG